MKVIDLAEAKDNLERYAIECRESPVVVSINGQPAFEISPLYCDDDGEFLNRLLQQSREFQELLQLRDEEAQRGETMSAADLRRELLNEGHR